MLSIDPDADPTFNFFILSATFPPGVVVDVVSEFLKRLFATVELGVVAGFLVLPILLSLLVGTVSVTINRLSLSLAPAGGLLVLGLLLAVLDVPAVFLKTEKVSEEELVDELAAAAPYAGRFTFSPGPDDGLFAAAADAVDDEAEDDALLPVRCLTRSLTAFPVAEALLVLE